MVAGGSNGYRYALNNPLRWIDPNGEAAQAALGCALGSWAGPLGCGVGAGATTLATILGASALLTGDTLQKCEDKACPPCTPYAKGTVGYIGPHTDHDHYPVGRPHLNLFVVNQNPNTCKCFWNKNTPDVASPPSQPGWVNLNDGFPALAP